MFEEEVTAVIWQGYWYNAAATNTQCLKKFEMLLMRVNFLFHEILTIYFLWEKDFGTGRRKKCENNGVFKRIIPNWTGAFQFSYDRAGKGVLFIQRKKQSCGFFSSAVVWFPCQNWKRA